MTLHLQECLDLGQREVLPVAQGHQLIKCAEQFKSIAENLPLVQALADTGGHLGEQVQTVDVLEDVGLAVGDEDDVQFVQWLVYEADVVLFDGGVLGSRVRKLGERGQQCLNSRPGNLSELAREDSLPPAGTYRRCENDL